MQYRKAHSQSASSGRQSGAVCLICSFRVAQPALARSLGMFVDSLVGYVESIESVVASIKVAPNVHARP